MGNSLGNKEKMAANIRRLLEKHGMTQTELAEAIGVPPTTVFNWCQAQTYPRIDKIEMMANFLNIFSFPLFLQRPDLPPGSACDVAVYTSVANSISYPLLITNSNALTKSSRSSVS